MSKKSKKGKRDKSERESKNKHKKKHNLKSKDSEKHKKSKKHKKDDEDKKKQVAEGGSVREEMNIPLELMEKPKNDMTPMTKEQWEKQQSIVRRVYDETTGRQRLIKGDGEVIEEIVSRDRHKEINKKATEGDKQYFQSKVFSNLK